MIPAAIKELKLYFVWDALTLALGPVWDTSIDRGCSMGGWLLGSSQPSI